MKGNPMTAEQTEIYSAAEHLSETVRGENALRVLLAWLYDGDGLGLDAENQEAVLTLLHGAWGPWAGTVRDAMREALGFHPVEEETR